jgi:hypothetical protein
MGWFPDKKYEKAGSLRRYLSRRLEKIFREIGTEGTYFIFVGKKWAWEKVKVD